VSDLTAVLAVTTATGVATGLGALPVFFRASVTHRTYDAALGLAAGIMLAASVFALIIPGMEAGGLTTVMAGVFVGGFGLLAANRFIPHVHERYRERVGHGGADPAPLDALAADRDPRLRRAVLVGGAITLHNAPEGLAMGVAFASGFESVALVLAVAIALQNVPDGFAFAVPAADTGMVTGECCCGRRSQGPFPRSSCPRSASTSWDWRRACSPSRQGSPPGR
jgi:ZIP family zinc transporter